MQKLLLYLIALLLIIFCNSCKPEKCDNPFRENIFGEWKLAEVSISKNNQNIVTLEYHSDSIIYDFQTNNKLVITGLADSLQLFDDFMEGGHYYEYKRLNHCPSGVDPGPNLNIDGQAGLVGRYFCTARLDDKTMYISGDINIGGVISGNGAIIGGNNYHLKQELIIYK